VNRAVLEVPLPIAVAHRGSRLLWPENTMEAFQGAVGLGFRWLETDLHRTRDGVLVCFHDDTLIRTTDGRGPVSGLDLADLRRLDAGYRFRRAGERPFRGTGVRVPTLEEVVSAFPDVSLIVDLKEDGIEEALLALIERRSLWDRLVVGSFSDERLQRFRELSGGRVATSTGSSETFRLWRAARSSTPPPLADAVQIPRNYRGIRVVTPATVAGFHRGGYQVHVWTVNREQEMETLLGWGVDGLISDRPDVLRSVLERRGTWTGRP
jgi:glycerophosphoryl diester phosphodiesterase